MFSKLFTIKCNFPQVITLMVVLVLLSACNHTNYDIYPSPSLPKENIVTAEKLPPYVYRLGGGDKIRVIVFGEEDMSGEFEVSNDGNVSLPYIRDVKVQNIDINTLEHKIETRYKSENILKNPKVNVEVLVYRPFYIHGEVIQGGEFPYKAGMDIQNAIAVAGGYTYRADDNIIYIRREGIPTIYQVDLSSSKSLPIYPGDNIQIPERFF